MSKKNLVLIVLVLLLIGSAIGVVLFHTTDLSLQSLFTGSTFKRALFISPVNGALDPGSESEGSIICNGETILAIGASRMAESFESSSLQCSFIQNFLEEMPGGTKITITDEKGKLFFEHQSAKTFNSIVFSSPDLVLGSTYTIKVGDQTETMNIDRISSGSSKNEGFGGPDQK